MVLFFHLVHPFFLSVSCSVVPISGAAISAPSGSAGLDGCALCGVDLT